ncbi:SnoaL-like domain-containing protein [Novosphingobium sp.]|uniref:SnoaL-like domain-containing protein n=1 Tax=Novosphingobium sp. TaxID=1874826 RepID=UPI00286E2FB4|nr:SnoaL-like domain-containing protein [Novosphingobium sp.]
MPTIHEVACDFTAMLRAGHFVAAGDRYWADNVTSVEPADLPGGIRASVSGIDAARIKCAARFGAVRIDEIGIDGPFVTGNQFALFLDLVTFDASSGLRQPFTEIALYTVRDGQIAEERHFYA